MSKYIDEIVKDIRENPDQWKRYFVNSFNSSGIMKDDIIIDNCGNGHWWSCYATSIVDVKFKGVAQGLWGINLLDRAKLERAYNYWQKNVSLETIKQ